jgi:hypothetical protein
MRRIGLVLLFAVVGCTHEQLVGFTSQKPRYFGVRVTKKKADVAGCEFKGKVEDKGTVITVDGAVTYGWAGFATAGADRMVQREDMVGDLGGNTLFDQEYEDGSDDYEAYLCPGRPLPALTLHGMAMEAQAKQSKNPRKPKQEN